MHSTGANTAKRYCLEYLSGLLERRGATPTTVLDLGCGDGRYGKWLLERYPGINYVGVEPYAPSFKDAQANFAGLRCELLNIPAYDVAIATKADYILSFSVLEHVQDLTRYFAAVQNNLADGGLVFCNYDYGHFKLDVNIDRRSGFRGCKQVAKKLLINNVLMPATVALRGERAYYERYVTDDLFAKALATTSLTITEDKAFNTAIKTLARLVRDSERAEFDELWFRLEKLLNSDSGKWQKRREEWFSSRNVLLTRNTAP